jgi:lipid A oxidase
MYNSKTAALLVLTPLAIFLLLGQRLACAENVFSIYTGSSFTRDSNLQLSQPGAGTAITVRDVKWDADPFKAAPYYGLRYAHFFDRYPAWGVALDFTHYKMIAQTSRVVSVNGTRQGAAVNTPAPMNQYVQRFEISHGVNILSLNGIYRWQHPSFAGGRLQPYAGAGLAYYRPHSENTVDNLFHETAYQSSGFGYQVLGGIQYRMTPRWGAFIEAKFNSGTAKVDIANGRAETPLRTFHALAGISYHF